MRLNYSHNLQKRTDLGLTRTRLQVNLKENAYAEVNGQQCIDFASSDYLGLTQHPALKQAVLQAINTYGVGSGASQMVAGYSKAHSELEQSIAAWLGKDRALLFSTGYMANLGVISSLADRHTALIYDQFNHASLNDAAILSRANLHRYEHCDYAGLANLIDRNQEKNKIICSEGVFSMEGSIADLALISKLSQQSNSLLIIDDAHGFGILGSEGRGAWSQAELSDCDNTIFIGTFSKAFGQLGGFVAGSNELIEYILQFAKTYTYTTGMPAYLAKANQVALEIIQQGELQAKLQSNIEYFKKLAAELNLNLLNSSSAIQPLLLSEKIDGVKLQANLIKHGYFVGLMRPPSVPANSSRLRITISAKQNPEQIQGLLAALSKEL